MNKIGLIAVSITSLILLTGYGIYWGITSLWPKDSAPAESTSPTAEEDRVLANLQALQNARDDRDGDGLPDLIEPLYSADPDNPDTDGDGTPDGNEVGLQRDPSIPGPNDTLLELGTAVPSPFPESATYTAKYFANLPANLSSNEILDPSRLEAFVAVNRGELLPAISPDSITVLPTSNEETIKSYLDSISSVQNPEITAINSDEIESIFANYIANPGNTAEIKTLSEDLSKNVAIFTALPVPSELKDFHITLIAGTQSLVNNIELLQKTPTDFVGGLIAAKNVEDLGVVFQNLAKEVSTLDEKYGF